MRKSETIEGQVLFYQFLWNTLLPVGFLTFLLRYKLNCGLSIERLAPSLHTCFVDRIGTLTLSALFIYLFLAVSWDSKLSLDIGRAVFAETARPRNWRLVEGRFAFSWVVFSNIALFALMAWYVDNVALFGLASAMFYLNACVYMVLLRRNTKRYFSDKRYIPDALTPHLAFILRRRVIVEQYLTKPHLKKEALMVTACLAASLLAFFGGSFNDYLSRLGPYVIIALAMLFNEITMLIWRRHRNSQLSAIDDEEATEVSDRLGEAL